MCIEFVQINYLCNFEVALQNCTGYGSGLYSQGIIWSHQRSGTDAGEVKLINYNHLDDALLNNLIDYSAIE